MDTTNFEQYFPFWNNLTDNEKILIENNSTIINYKKGDIIHSASENCIGMIFVKTGELRTYMMSEDGREITLYRLFNNDICTLSASCVLSAITFDVFIDANENSDIILINAHTINKLMKENIYVEAFVYRTTTEHFSDVMWAMEQILFMSFDKRLAIFLAETIAKNNSNEIKMTHEQIAKQVGSAREVVSRMLKYFANDGIVELFRGGITIIDKKKLNNLATCINNVDKK